MAQFYAEIQGDRGAATRKGNKKSGLFAHVRGWNIGVRVECRHEDGKDVIEIHRTGGSNRPATQGRIMIYEGKGGE